MHNLNIHDQESSLITVSHVSLCSESEGIRFVNDLLKADIQYLSVRLMAFDGFKLACAMAAWKRKQVFLKVYRLSLAIQSIRKWKLVAETWWKQTALSDWDNKEGLIASFLSTQESLLLESKFGIIAADQLLISSHQNIIEELGKVMDFGPKKRPQEEVQLICEGMFHSWLMRAREKSMNADPYKFDSLPDLNFDHVKENISNSAKHSWQSLSSGKGHHLNGMVSFHEKSHKIVAHECDSWQTNSVHPANPSASKYTEQSKMSLFLGSTSVSSIHTPMSCLDFLFIKSQNITSDEELSQIDLSITTEKYRSFLEKNNCNMSLLEASGAVNKWMLDASKQLGRGFNIKESVTRNHLPATRIDKSPKNLTVMYNICNLCKTVLNNGLPTKIIYCFDDAHGEFFLFCE